MMMRILMCLLCLLSIACSVPPENREWHVVCYSGGTKTYDGRVKDNLVENHTNVRFTEKSTNETIILTENCVIRSEKIQDTNSDR